MSNVIKKMGMFLKCELGDFGGTPVAGRDSQQRQARGFGKGRKIPGIIGYLLLICYWTGVTTTAGAHMFQQGQKKGLVDLVMIQ